MPPGTTLGPLRSAVAAETGLHSAKVVLPGSHDTASAVMPANGGPRRQGGGSPGRRSSPHWCYVSLGTWALLGVELRSR